jgi:Tol biopolymer transport system component
MANRGSTRLLLVVIFFLAGCGSAQVPATADRAATNIPPDAAAPGQPVLSEQAAGNTASEPTCPDARTPLDAPIIFGSGNNLNMIGPDGGGMRVVLDLPDIAWAHEPVWSPDGSTLAYMLSLPATSNDIPGLQISVICAVDRTTGTGRLLLRGSTPIEALEEPAWTPDGRALIVTRRETAVDPQTGYITSNIALARYELADSSFKVLVEGGASATLSPDGERLAYIRYDEQTAGIVLMLARGDGSEGRLIAEVQPPFGVFAAPRWSPDGSRLLFTASGGPLPAGNAPSHPRKLLDALLGIQVAQAHGEPAGLWIVDRDGQNLRALTQPDLDDPRGAWSPDGAAVALVSGNRGGVALIDVDDKQRQRLTDQGDYGGIAWAPVGSASR